MTVPFDIVAVRAVISLADPAACRAEVAGAKAANLAECALAGAPVQPGFVLTTAGTARGTGDAAVLEDLRSGWDDLGGGVTPLVVRSSSTIEDAGESSMAGQFTSVLDVEGWDDFVEAVDRVIDSAGTVGDQSAGPLPMAVLVQSQLDAPLGGVMFGVDPVGGRRHRIVVESVPSRPDTLVGGSITAAHHELSRTGRVRSSSHTDVAPKLSRSLRRSLVRLAGRTARHFGSPQDIEWAVDHDGTLWLLQSRPVTAVAPPPASGCLLGPGPVAETFPHPLSPLEVDLWVEPLRDGIVRALRVTGAVSPARLEDSPVLTTVGGWAAVDLEILGLTRGEESFWRRITPPALIRHVAVAWRVGRARVALPDLAADLIGAVDAHLVAVPELQGSSLGEILGIMAETRQLLSSVHAHEVLTGMLLHDQQHTTPTGIVALAALARARSEGVADAEIVELEPVVLALTAPSISMPRTLPPPTPPSNDTSAPADHTNATVDDLGLRDALRLRTRWLQELLAVAARAAGARLHVDDRIPDAHLVAQLSWDELAAAAEGGCIPDDLGARARIRSGAPLPESFRLSADGDVIAAGRQGHDAQGVPAGGGRIVGEVRHRVAPGAEHRDIVLVTRHLEPELAPLLPSLTGLVAETGSSLSHLAILAREMEVPTVVGVHDAVRRFPPGTQILVDGTVGEVRAIDEVDGRTAGSASDQENVVLR